MNLYLEKLIRRYEEEIQGEIDSDGRPRRQLPTEINIQVTAPLFTARLYDYGTADGDKQVPPSVDVGMRLELTHPITFYGQKYNEVYVRISLQDFVFHPFRISTIVFVKHDLLKPSRILTSADYYCVIVRSTLKQKFSSSRDIEHMS